MTQHGNRQKLYRKDPPQHLPRFGFAATMRQPDLLGGGMKRRNFIAELVGAAALRPCPGSAQRPQRNVPLVGVIWIGTASAQIPVRVREAFLQGLRENGYAEGQSLRTDTLEMRQARWVTLPTTLCGLALM
jgi:hypothetical protein